MASSKTSGEAPVTWHFGKGSHIASPGDARQPNTGVELPLASLIDIQSLRSLLNDFSALVGIATALLDLEGTVIQFAGWQKACTEFHRPTARSCANCNTTPPTSRAATTSASPSRFLLYTSATS